MLECVLTIVFFSLSFSKKHSNKHVHSNVVGFISNQTRSLRERILAWCMILFGRDVPRLSKCDWLMRGRRATFLLILQS